MDATTRKPIDSVYRALRRPVVCPVLVLWGDRDVALGTDCVRCVEVRIRPAYTFVGFDVELWRMVAGRYEHCKANTRILCRQRGQQTAACNHHRWGGGDCAL